MVEALDVISDQRGGPGRLTVLDRLQDGRVLIGEPAQGRIRVGDGAQGLEKICGRRIVDCQHDHVHRLVARGGDEREVEAEVMPVELLGSRAGAPHDLEGATSLLQSRGVRPPGGPRQSRRLDCRAQLDQIPRPHPPQAEQVLQRLPHRAAQVVGDDSRPAPPSSHAHESLRLQRPQGLTDRSTAHAE